MSLVSNEKFNLKKDCTQSVFFWGGGLILALGGKKRCQSYKASIFGGQKQLNHIWTINSNM